MDIGDMSVYSDLTELWRKLPQSRSNSRYKQTVTYMTVSSAKKFIKISYFYYY